ncbi:MAG: hypothetical protein AAGN82_15750, partial [Myxococcota bacterium]
GPIFWVAALFLVCVWAPPGAGGGSRGCQVMARPKVALRSARLGWRLAGWGLVGCGLAAWGLGRPALAYAQDEPIGEPSAYAAEGEDEDVVRYPPTPVRYGLIGGGLGLFGAAYGTGAAFAAGFSRTPGIDALYIPVAGPWIAIGRNGCPVDNPDCGAIVPVRAILYALEGIVQLGGLALVGEGIFMTTEATAAPSPSDEGAAEAEVSSGTSWHVTPLISPGMTGLGVQGRF